MTILVTLLVDLQVAWLMELSVTSKLVTILVTLLVDLQVAWLMELPVIILVTILVVKVFQKI